MVLMLQNNLFPIQTPCKIPASAVIKTILFSSILYLWKFHLKICFCLVSYQNFAVVCLFSRRIHLQFYEIQRTENDCK